MDNMKKRTAAGTAMALVGGAFWGLSGVCGQYLFQTKEMTATWLVPVRLFVSGLLLLAFFLARDAKRTLSVWKNKKTAIDLLIYSFAGIMLCQYGDGRSVYRPGIDRCICMHYDAPEAASEGNHGSRSGSCRYLCDRDAWQSGDAGALETCAHHGSALCVCGSCLHRAAGRAAEAV